MALPAILSGGSKLLSGGSRLARTANVGRKLLGIKGKKNKETRVEDNEPSAIIVRPSTSLIPATINVSDSQSTTEPQSTPVSGKSTLEEDVEYIKNKTLEIDKLLKSSFAQRKKEAAKLRKSRENARRSKKEEGYEKGGSSGILGKAKEKVKAPFSNIFEGIKNYLTSIVLGFIAVRLIPLLPKLIELAKFIAPVVNFITDFAGVILNGLVTFIDWGYKAYDATAGFIKNIGGEDAAKVFDKFSGAFTLFANLAIVAGLAAARAGDGPDFGKGRKTGIGKGRKGPTPISGRGKGRQRTTTSRSARKYFDRFGRDAAEKRFGKDAVKSLGGKYGRSGVTNTFRKGATAVADKIGGRGGVKALASLGKIGKFLKVPVIGSIISVVLSLMNGDPIQKALFKGVGTAIGGALGGLLSTAIGVPPLGLFLGGIVGDYVGDLLYTLFFGGGLKAAGAKLGNDLKGMFMGIGKGAKAIFDWVFGGGLLSLLKNVGGGIAKFALYLLNPGGLLWDILKAGGNALKAITGFVFGGGLFDLIKNITGGVFKFITYILNPGGLLFDALKQGGKIAKAIFDFAINAIGSTVQFIKDFIGGIFSRFIGNFPSIGIPKGFGIQTTLGKLLGWIPFLQPYMEDGRLTAFPDLSMFIPGLGLPFFTAHLGKSMFPGSFFDSMPSGLGDVWKGSTDAVKNITEGVTNTVTNVAKGTQRVGRGIADALTFNVFDFDKKNEVEKKEEGGTVGLTAEEKEKKLKSDKIIPTIKSPELSIKDVGATLKGSGKTGEKIKSLYKPAGIIALTKLGNEFRKIPIVGESMATAVRIALGIKPDSRTFDTIGANLINFATLDNIDGIASSPGELAQVVTKMETGGEVDFISDVESLDNSAKAINMGNFLKTELQRLDLTAVDKEEEKKQESIFDKLFGLFKPKKDPNKEDDETPDAPGASGSSLDLGSTEYGEGPLIKTATQEGIKDKELAAFLAQMAHETGNFKYRREIGGGKSHYSGGGPWTDSSGKTYTAKYHGRGYVQLTHDYNYEKYGKRLGIDLLENPDLAMQGDVAARIAVMYWKDGVRPMVKGDWDNVFLHSAAVNNPSAKSSSDINGYDDRVAKYNKYVKQIGSGELAKKVETSMSAPKSPGPGGADPGNIQVQRGDPSKAAARLLKDFPQIKTRDNSKQIYASGLGFWLKKNFVPPAKDPHRKGKGDLGDPYGGDMEHGDHGGVVGIHGGSGHGLNLALDLGGYSAAKGGIHKDDQKYMWPYISRFLRAYGLDKEPTVPQVLYGRGESFSPVGPKSGADGGHDDHFHVEFQGGGLIQKNENNISRSLQTKMSYDKKSTRVLIQPVITERTITKTKPIPIRSTSSAGGGGVNNVSDSLFAG